MRHHFVVWGGSQHLGLGFSAIFGGSLGCERPSFMSVRAQVLGSYAKASDSCIHLFTAGNTKQVTQSGMPRPLSHLQLV